MQADLNQSVVELHKAFHEFKDTLKEIHKAEIKGHVDILLKEKADRINDALSKSEEAIDEAKKAKEAAEVAQSLMKQRHEVVDGQKGKFDPKQKSAFLNYLRKGKDEITHEEKAILAEGFKTMSVISNPDGGYVVVPEIDRQIVEYIYLTSPVRQFAGQITVGSDEFEFVVEDGENEFDAGWVGEEEDRPVTATGKFDKTSIKPHEIYAEPKVTQKLLDDAFINIESYISSRVGDKIARVENAAFINGNGVKKPRGILTYPADTTVNPDLNAYGTIKQVVSGVAGDVAYDGFINLITSLKPVYQQNARFMANRLTIAKIRMLKDGIGRPYWVPGLGGEPSTVFEYPIVAAADIPAPTSGSLSVIFGDFARGYLIIDRMGIRMLRDPFTDKPYVKYYTTKRVGGGVKNFDALKILKLSVS